MPKPSLQFAVIAAFATAAIAFSAASLMRPTGASAQQAGESKPAEAKHVFSQPIVAYIDFGRVVSENKGRERDGMKLRRDQEAIFNEAKREIDAETESIRADLRKYLVGSTEYRNLQKRVYKLEDSKIIREAELNRSTANDLERINKRHYDRMIEVIGEYCRAHGITALLNLKNTRTNDPGRIDITSKVFDDVVVWFDKPEYDITDAIVAIMNKVEADEEKSSTPQDKPAPKPDDNAAPTPADKDAPKPNE